MGLVQERRNSIANALELRLSCTNPSIWHDTVVDLCGIALFSSLVWVEAVPRFNIKTTSLGMNSHYRDETIVWPSYLYNGNPYIGNAVCLYWNEPQMIYSIIFVMAAYCHWDNHIIVMAPLK